MLRVGGLASGTVRRVRWRRRVTSHVSRGSRSEHVNRRNFFTPSCVVGEGRIDGQGRAGQGRVGQGMVYW